MDMENVKILCVRILTKKEYFRSFIVSILDDIESKYSAKCEKYSKKGKKHIKVTDFDFEIRPKKVVFDFENLIDRNEQLSKEVVKTLNENSEVVYKDVSPAFDEVMARIWKETINRVFSKVPQEELFLP